MEHKLSADKNNNDASHTATELINSLFSLPKELLQIIITEVNIFDIVMIRTTCKFLYNLVKASDSFPRHFVLDQQKCLEYYVSNGNISALDYLKAMNFLFTSPLCERAAETGRLDVLKYLRANGCLWNRMMPIFAARNGHVDILQYALEGDTKVQPLFDTQIVNMCFVEAATKGHVEVIKYLHQRGYAWDSQTVMLASHYRQFEVFKYAVEQGKFTPDYNHYGDLQFMTFAEEHNLARWKADACLRAAVNGDLEALKFAHECGAPLGLESGLGALVLAAENGHLECVKYAYMHDEKEFGRVSSVKNLEILKFLHEETDIQLDPEIYVEAVRNRRKDIVDYLLQHTSIPPPGGLARHAASTGDVKYLEWAVVDRGFDTSPLRAQYDNNIDVYATAITAGSLDCLKFAAEKKLPMGRDEDWYFSRIFEVRPPAMVEMVRWWTETYPFVFSERNTAKAIQHGSVELLDLMVQKGAKFSDDDISHVNNVRNLAYMLKATGVSKTWEIGCAFGDVTCYKYALEHGWKCTPKILHLFIQPGEVGADLLHYFVQNNVVDIHSKSIQQYVMRRGTNSMKQYMKEVLEKPK